jgi:hypothetical protein
LLSFPSPPGHPSFRHILGTRPCWVRGITSQSAAHSSTVFLDLGKFHAGWLESTRGPYRWHDTDSLHHLVKRNDIATQSEGACLLWFLQVSKLAERELAQSLDRPDSPLSLQNRIISARQTGSVLHNQVSQHGDTSLCITARKYPAVTANIARNQKALIARVLPQWSSRASQARIRSCQRVHRERREVSLASRWALKF